MPTSNQCTLTSEGCNQNEWVVDEEACGKEADSSINISSDWVNIIDYIPHIIWPKCLAVKYLISRWMSEAPEYGPISSTYLGATDCDHSRQNEDWPRCMRGSAASRWRGSPWSRYYQLAMEHCSQHNPQRICTWVSWWGGQAAGCPSYSPINRWPCSRPLVLNSRPQVFNSRPARN